MAKTMLMLMILKNINKKNKKQDCYWDDWNLL